MNKGLSLLIIIMLMMGILPPMHLFAAGTPTIDIVGLYTPDAAEYVSEDISKIPSDLNKVTRETTKNITLRGNYYNFDPVQVEKFYYTITSVRPNGTGGYTYNTIVYDKNTPLITGDTSFEFRNVVIKEGLNKIVIYSYNGSSTSKAAWVYYNPVTTITDLLVNEEVFEDGMIIPADPLNEGTSVIITGTAPNAESVVIQKLGESTPYSGYFNSQTGYFQFKVDATSTNRLADIKLDGGDQQFEIIATNDTQKMTIKRTFVYNDGTPFLFENKVAKMNADSSLGDLKELVTQPVIEGTTNEVYFEGNIKVEVDPTDPNVLLYNEATVTIPNESGSDEITFDLINQMVSLNGNASLNATIILDAVRSTEQFKVFTYTIEHVQINAGQRQQSILTTFSNGVGMITKPTYYFDYINTDLPYIAEVRFLDTNIALVDDTKIYELPISVKAIPNTTSANLTAVNIYYDGNKPLPYLETINASEGEYRITWLPEGLHNLTFVPVDINGVEQPIGSITRSINYIPMQYIIVNNIYNGQIFEDYSLHEIQGRLVNVPVTNDVNMYLGDKLLPIVRNADDTFTVNVDGKLSEGKNTISFIIVDQNNDIVSESNLDIYVFTTKAPQLIMDIDPRVTNQFVEYAKLPLGQYVTREKSIALIGTFSESSSITVNIYRKDDDGEQDDKTGIWTYPAFSDTKNFNNQDDEMDIYNVHSNTNGTAADGNFYLTVDLSSLGTTTVQVQVTNASGILSTNTIEVMREPLPYEIIYPNLQRTNIVNSNFVRIEMLAEGADAVYFKKDSAKKDWIIDRQGNYVEGYVYEISNLKAGKNKIKFSVLRGDQSIDGELEIINADTPIIGATYKSPISSKMKIFDGLVELSFPKGTLLRRNDDSTINPYLSDERQVLFGIAEDIYGRVDKYRHPLSSELQKDRDNDGNVIDNFYPSINSKAKIGRNFLEEPTGRFIAASPLIWVDAGTLKENADDIDDIIYGSGQLPYNASDIFYERYLEDQVIPTNRGEITLKYNDNIRGNTWPYLTIYHYNYNEEKHIYEWQNIGGVVDTKSQTIAAPIDSLGYFRVMHMNQSYDDVIGHNWARNDLDTLYSKGIMVNKFSDQFVPEENITRGEFVTLLVKAFELPLDYEGASTFYDVFKNPRFIGNALYEYKYIETAARYGIVRGRLEGTFAPNESITRQDAAVMIARTANLKTSSVTSEKDIERTKKNLQKLYTDANLISLYAAPAVEAVVKAGLMNGKPNIMLEGQSKQSYRYDPTFELKRSEAARIVMNVLKQQKKIPK